MVPRLLELLSNARLKDAAEEKFGDALHFRKLLDREVDELIDIQNKFGPTKPEETIRKKLDNVRVMTIAKSDRQPAGKVWPRFDPITRRKQVIMLFEQPNLGRKNSRPSASARFSKNLMRRADKLFVHEGVHVLQVFKLLKFGGNAKEKTINGIKHKNDYKWRPEIDAGAKPTELLHEDHASYVTKQWLG